MGEPALVPEVPNRLLLVVYRPEGSHALLGKMEAFFESKPGVEVFVVNELDAALERLRSATHAVVVFGIATKEQLPELARLLSEGDRLAKGGLLKVAGFLSPAMTHPKVLTYLLTQFSVDILQNQVAEKSLRYKIGQAVSVVTAAHSMVPLRKAGPEVGKVFWQDPMAMEEDCWVIRRARDLQYRQTNWALTLVGPPPVVGDWVAEPGLNARGLDAWVFRLNEQYRAFQPLPGRWVFWGKMPVFSFESLLWLMISNEPRLVFMTDQGTEHVRIESGDHILKAARNGPRAHFFRSQIQQLLLAERRFNTGRERKPDFEIHLETIEAGKVLEAEVDAPQGGGEDYRESRKQEGKILEFRGAEERRDGGGARAFAREQVEGRARRRGGFGDPEHESEPTLDEKQQSYDQLLTSMGFSLTLSLSNGSRVSARMLDLFECQLSVEVDAETRLRKDHRLACRFEVSQPEKNLEILTEGVVTEIESIEDGMAVICIEITPIAPESMEILLRMFKDRQQSITDFMNSARGR